MIFEPLTVIMNLLGPLFRRVEEAILTGQSQGLLRLTFSMDCPWQLLSAFWEGSLQLLIDGTRPMSFMDMQM